MDPRKILILDDNEAMCDNLAEITLERAYTPIIAHSCAQALRLMDQERPHIALLDLKLPDGLSTSLLSRFKAMVPSCACVIMTAFGDLNTAIHAIELGVYRYLQKPVRPVELLGILEQIQETQALQAERDQLAAVVQHTAEGMLLTDEAGIIHYANAAFVELSGVRQEGLLGRSALKLLVPHQEHPEILRTLIQRRRPWLGVSEARMKTQMHLNLTISPVLPGVGPVKQLVISASDNTHAWELEAKLRQAQKMEAIGTLAGGIAHDFNNILSAIVGYAELSLLDLDEAAPAHANIQRLLEATEQAKSLIKRILTYSRHSDDAHQVIDVCQIVKTTAQLLSAALPASIHLEVSYSDVSCDVLADPIQLQQVVLNLVNNAAQAMEQRGVIQVSVTRRVEDEGCFAVLRVEDNGPGIPEEIQARIFDPYFSTKAPGEGTGLGLATAQGACAAHGGTISLKSALGQGAAFTVRLPLARVQTQTTPPPLLKICEGGGQRVLYVDDDERVGVAVTHMLKSLGYQVVYRRSVDEAELTLAPGQALFDLIITDLTMPGRSGLDFARLLRARAIKAPVILTTGNPTQLNPEELKALSIAQVLNKPFNISRLSQQVHAALIQGDAPR